MIVHQPGAGVVARWSIGRHRLATLAIVATAFGLLLGLALGHWRSSPGPLLRPMTMAGRWIKAPGSPGYVGHFRRRIHLPGPVKHAWIAVAAREGFEVSVNRALATRSHLWKASQPFQTGLSEGGQVLNPGPAMLELNFPREYQWSSHRGDWLPTFTDITPLLRPGPNAITVEVESHRAPAALRLDGEVLLWSGETIRLDSGADWVAEPAPPFDSRYDWLDPKYPDRDWRAAVVLPGPSRDAPDFHLLAFDPDALTTPLAGHWLAHPDARASDAAWFRGEWDLPVTPDDAWVRLAVNRAFDLFLNGRRVQLARPGEPDLDSGDWVFGPSRGADLPSTAEPLDPAEVGSLYVGKRFEQPRAGDQGGAQFDDKQDSLNPERDNKRLTTRAKLRPAERKELPGTYDAIRPEGEGGLPHDPLPPVPQGHQAKALGRDRAVGGLVAYNVRSMVHAGRNTIEVRLAPPMSPEPFGWAPRLALDGSALFRDGSRVDLASEPSSGWTARVQDARGEFGPSVDCSALGPARVIGNLWPATDYRGIAHDPSQLLMEKLGWVAGSTMATWLLAASMLAIVAGRAGLAGRSPRPAVLEASGRLARALLMPVAVLASALLVEGSWLERHEALLFRIPRVWPGVLIAVAASPLLLARPFLALAGRVVRLPRTRAWPWLVGSVLVLAAALRFTMLDFQPIFDDEYASLQAVLGIARGGTPKLAPEGVYYTRSPLYHYMVGAVVRMFGENFWSFRLPSAIAGVATALLTYRIGSSLMKRPWVGLGAMAFYAIHPYAIYSSHMIRFYQHQQFFMVLAVCWFCRGFLGEPSQRHRYLTILAFLAAVLCQEISATMALQLGLGMFLLGRDAGWAANVKLGLMAASALALIAVDVIIFQTWCLTRTEGVSPNVEPRIEPHFWDPYNLMSVFLGYSRLHAGISLALLCGSPLLIRRGGRVTWALAFFLISGVVLTNVLVTAVAFRYQYWMVPLLLLLSFRGVGLMAGRLAIGTRQPGESDTRPVAAALCVPVFFSFFLAFSPWRIVDSYDTKILNDSTGAFRHVAAHFRAGDAVAASEPHPPAALLELGVVTYDLSIPLLHDFVMLQEGRLVDRNGGAEVLASVDDVMAACRRHDRLWVVVNREKFRSRGGEIQWGFPGARLELYLRRNLQVAYANHGWTVFLWDQSRGHHASFRGQ